MSRTHGWTVLVNGAAGSTDREAVDTAVAVLRGHGDVEVVATAGRDEVDAVIAGLGPRTLVVAGGDGSLHLAVERLRALDRADVPVGLLPLGTGNDLARGVGIPLDDPAAAAQRLVDGTPRRLDVLVDRTGWACVNALHAGVGADAAAHAEALKDRLSAVAYPVGALLAGVTAEGVRTEVIVDGEVVVDDDVLLVVVCNGASFGGGTRAAPDADPADGSLDVVVVTATGPVARASFALDLQRGVHLDRDDVHLAVGREVTIRGEGLRYDVDGELSGDDGPAPEDRERTWRVERRAWTLVH
ncbi:diacylglycerol kinase [Nitriliruptoraceae bacterium ZYF776]|nr:diacylglycerol kinase [Profundirhabdus halotolerans]